VTVQDTIGGGEVVFFNGVASASNLSAPWIQGPPHSYIFRLYNTTGGGHTFMGLVTVTGNSGVPNKPQGGAAASQGNGR